MKKEFYSALIVGAGVAGMKSALDLAEAGHEVLLIDKRHSLGGLLSQLDYQFPTDHCGMCKMLPLTERDDSSQFCLRKGFFHKNIHILTGTELEALEGDPGRFSIVLRQKSKLVDIHKCISCGECSRVCPVRVPDEFNSGLSSRFAIYLPVPHSIPNQYVVDLENCTMCRECLQACPTSAIDFKLEQKKDFPILILDSDPGTGQNLQQWLQDQNFPLQLSQSLQDAQTRLESDQSFALLFMDVATAGEQAEKFLARALEVQPEIQVVLMGEEQEEQRANKLMQQGAGEFLLKPLQPDLVPWLDKLFLRITSDTKLELEAAAVILAAGFETFDPGCMDTLAFGELPRVITSLQFERLCSGTGPRDLNIYLKDKSAGLKIAWMQCVGSRDLQRNADFCSSYCCMASIKEAMLVQKITEGKAETSIYYMDLRTFGKEHQRYRDWAEQAGVKFIRNRIHSVSAADSQDKVRLQVLDENGKMLAEDYDLLVLAVGARPAQNMQAIARCCDIELNESGFCRTQNFFPARTSRFGVFAAGSFAGPKDIAESIIQAGAAAQGASRMSKLYAPLLKKSEPSAPDYKDVSMEKPKVLIALCVSCPTLEQSVNFQELCNKLRSLPDVDQVFPVQAICTSSGWSKLEELAGETQPNRILIGACQPYAYIPKLKELGHNIKLFPNLMQVTDILTPIFAANGLAEERLQQKIFSELSMAVSKLRAADPTFLPPLLSVSPNALVVGGGLAGLKAATAIAEQGFEVYLVEKEEKLGGQCLRIFDTLQGDDPQKFMQELVERVEKSPKIHIFCNSRVTLSTGRAGRFQSALIDGHGQAHTLEHGATILATGGRETVTDEYGYGKHASVLTQMQLQEQLAGGNLDTGALHAVAMIQCVGSREEPHNYCSRICCRMALNNALKLKRRNPDLQVYVFYRDMMTYGFTEHYFTQARNMGIVFIRYQPGNKPRVDFQEDRPVITAREDILQQDIQINPDLLILSTGIEPEETDELQEIFNVSVDEDGFFQEAEAKWRPVEFWRQGIFCCGLAHAPGNMNESIASAQAAAQRAVSILSREHIHGSRITASVRHSLCSLCRRCVEICEFNARYFDPNEELILVDELLCQGCGACAAVCPNSASVIRGFMDGQVMSIIHSALHEEAR